MKPTPLPIFHAFTTKYSGRVDRIITPVAVFPAFDPTQSQQTPIQRLDTTSLWDTGATNSAVTQKTAQALDLVPVRQATLGHAGGSSLCNVYMVNLILPNNIGIVGTPVNECNDAAGDFGAIIGMDIITRGDLAITNVDSHTWVTFRFPSVQHVDYVAEAQKINFSGVGRNAPCPCGKQDSHGKPVKFKNCHGKVT